jgi:REP element-mobilizing transposase RayT
MPRKSRIDAPGALQHVIGRGIDRREIFSHKADYKDFLERLGQILSETNTCCYAWALIPNHFHLLLRTGAVPVSRVVQRLLTGYVVNYNRRHRRSGHLFQNRYTSILCQEDPYLLELVRYIHLNPLRAKLVSGYSALGRHPYCGHGVILGSRKNDWQDVDYVLRLFGDEEGSARERYSEFVRAGIEQGRRSDLTGGGLLRSQGGWSGVKALRRSGEYHKGDERILGDSNFVDEVLSQAEEHLEERYRLQAEGFDLDKLMERVCNLVGTSPEGIMERGKERLKVDGRSILCYWATDRLGISQKDLAKRLRLTQPAVSQAVRRGKDLVKSKKLSLFPETKL